MPIQTIEVTITNNETGETFVDDQWTRINGLGVTLRALKPGKPEKPPKQGIADLELSGPVAEGRTYLTGWLRASFVNPKTENPFRDLTIVLRNDDATEAARYNLFDTFPVRWDPGEYSPSSNVATETVVCKMGRVELA